MYFTSRYMEHNINTKQKKKRTKSRYMNQLRYKNIKRTQECWGQLPWEKALFLADEYICNCSLFSSALAMDLDNIYINSKHDSIKLMIKKQEWDSFGGK